MKPKISIAFNTINGLEFLKKTIPAWLSQDYENFEVILFDDSSQDGTEEFVKKNYPQVKFSRSETRVGYEVGKNTCVAACTGEYVLLLDNDILPKSKDYLTKLLATYEKLENVSFLGVGLYDSGSAKTKYYGIYYSIYGVNVHKKAVDIKEVESAKGPLLVPSYHGGAVFFKKEIFEKLGGYDTIQPFMLDDTDISARSYALGYKVYLYNAELLEHTGMSNHDDKAYFAWKFKYYISGALTVMLKNFAFKELYRVLCALLVYPFMYISIAYKRKNWGVLLAYFLSLGQFIKNLPQILKQRKLINQNRKTDNSSFLYIKEPF